MSFFSGRWTARRSLRAALLSFANKRGYEIRKAPEPGYSVLPVFDVLVQLLMARRGRSLTFVQVGANDGVQGDPLRAYVVANGWRGVLVEPQPEVMATLRSNYADSGSALAFEQVAVSDHGPTLRLFRAPAAGAAGSFVVSAERDRTAHALSLQPDQLEAIDVPAMRLDDLLRKHGLAELDLLQIDAEGHEWNILRTLDLEKHRPTLIQMEFGQLTPAIIRTIVRHLDANGYLVYFGGHQADSVALDRKFLD